MGGEVSTHRTLCALGDTTVFTTQGVTDYTIDGVQVKNLVSTDRRDLVREMRDILTGSDTDVVYTHASLSAPAVKAARAVKIPSILAVHAPPRYAQDLRGAWTKASMRLYNTESARREWRDPQGCVLHPPVGMPDKINGRGDAYTLTSSLVNKGVNVVLGLAQIRPSQRFIIVESPAHKTHGDSDFWEKAAKIPNVEVWPRLEPHEMHVLWRETRMLLVPSFYETYGMSAVEAAFQGIPSVHVRTSDVLEGIGTAAQLIRPRCTLRDLAMAVDEVEDLYNAFSKRASERAWELQKREIKELSNLKGYVRNLK